MIVLLCCVVVQSTPFNIIFLNIGLGMRRKKNGKDTGEETVSRSVVVLVDDVADYGPTWAYLLAVLRSSVGASRSGHVVTTYTELGRLCGLARGTVRKHVGNMARHNLLRVTGPSNRTRVIIRLTRLARSGSVGDGSIVDLGRGVPSPAPLLRKIETIEDLLNMF